MDYVQYFWIITKKLLCLTFRYKTNFYLCCLVGRFSVPPSWSFKPFYLSGISTDNKSNFRCCYVEWECPYEAECLVILDSPLTVPLLVCVCMKRCLCRLSASCIYVRFCLWPCQDVLLHKSFNVSCYQWNFILNESCDPPLSPHGSLSTNNSFELSQAFLLAVPLRTRLNWE